MADYNPTQMKDAARAAAQATKAGTAELVKRVQEGAELSVSGGRAIARGLVRLLTAIPDFFKRL